MLNVEAIGITVKYGYAGSGRYGWVAVLHWQDDKFFQKGTVEGEIRTRYFEETIGSAIDYVVDVAKQFNLPFTETFFLYYEKDGKNTEENPPENWKEILYEEAQKRGWRTYSLDKVDIKFACPNCGEDNVDNLIWNEDSVICEACRTKYTP